MVAMIFSPKAPYQASMARLALLGFSSILVYFITLSVPYLIGFAAFPLVIATTYYKRGWSFSLILICSLIVFLLLQISDNQWISMLFPLYLLAAAMAVVVGEILLREIPPIKAILSTGIFLVALIFVGGGTLVQQNKEQAAEFLRTSLMSIQDQVQEKSPKDSIEFKDHIQFMIDRVDKIVVSTPVYVFISIFLGIWLNLYLILRGHRTLGFVRNYPYQLKDLTRLRLPNWTAYGAIGVLALYVLPAGRVGSTLQDWAEGAAYVLGTFFFLQGFGVYLEYLDFLKVRGFFRSFLVFITAVFAHAILAILGLFDLWFNFRKFFKDKGKAS